MPEIAPLDYLFILLGLLGLFLGGEALVRGSVSIARRMAISPFIIGLTVVGFGTSTPELLVSVQAALRGVPDIALGNVIGSNIANILLILGVTALVWPIRAAGVSAPRDTSVMVVSALVLVPLFLSGAVGQVAGLALVLALFAYLTWTALASRKAGNEPDTDSAPEPLLKALLWGGLGLVALVFGARFLVDGAVAIARDFNISEAFIGLTIVAVGTSLPELATSLIAALRRQSDIAIGNVIGSNIFNVLGILGVTAAISPIPVSGRFIAFDLPVMIAASVFLALVLMCAQVGRGWGVVMLIAYGVYVFAAR